MKVIIYSGLLYSWANTVYILAIILNSRVLKVNEFFSPIAVPSLRWSTVILLMELNQDHSMSCSQFADGGDSLQIWRVAANILNKKLWTTDKEWSFSLVVGHGAK
jgi:hypothetical protein